MSYFYCTCTTNKKDKNNIRKNMINFREVKVDIDGVCLDCGHYAVASHKKVDPYNGELYRAVIGDTKAPKIEKVKGGLSLKSSKDISKGYYDKRRKDKNGNMDV